MRNAESKNLYEPKLLNDGSNWITYRMRIRVALRYRQILHHIDEVIPRPESADQEKAKTTEQREYSEFPIEKWEENEAIARHMIISTVPDSIVIQIASKTTVKEMWDTLEMMFKDRPELSADALEEKMSQIKCKTNGNVQEHFAKLTELQGKLAAIGHPLSDSAYVWKIIRSLPEEYNAALSTVVAISKLDGTKVTPAVLTRHILNDYDMRVANGSIKPKKSGAGTKKCTNKRCHIYGEIGHLKKNCWAW